MDPLERVDDSIEWKEFCTPFGRRYYYNKVTRQSQWSIPDELKAARDLLLMASKFYQTYREKKYGDIIKEKLDSGNEDYESEEIRQEYNLLCKWVHQQLCDKVEKVQISKSLCLLPCVLESAKHGWSTNMKALTLGDTSKFMRTGMIFKINPDHPIFKYLNVAFKCEFNNRIKAKAVIEFLYEAALISSGHIPESPAQLYEKIYLILEIVLTDKWGRSDRKEGVVVAGGANSSKAMSIEVTEPSSEVKHNSSPMEGLVSSLFDILRSG